MFVGAVPRPAVEQITRTVPFTTWREVFVGCSGSFRFDRAVKDVHPSVLVHSNDVSLLSCSLGALATGTELPITFTGRLAFIQEALLGQPFNARVAAVEVALEMARYKSSNTYAQTHFAHYQSRFSDFLAPALARLAVFLEHLDVASFHAGDFRQQAIRAAAAGGGVAAFPPTYKNGYERLYRFVDENTEWDRPAYEVWDPARTEDWLDELDAMGVHYCVLTDHTLQRHEPVTVYRSNANKPVYTFADRAASSVRRCSHKSEPFRYVPTDPAALTARSTVAIVAATSAQMNFLKDIYLAKAIAHTSGIANFLVLIGATCSDEQQERLHRKMNALTKGDLTAPIVAVGWNSERFDGRNLALRLVALGYTQVYWYRGGREAWEVQGLPESDVDKQEW